MAHDRADSQTPGAIGSWLRLAAFAAPWVVIGALLGAYVISPSWYLRCLIEPLNRERQVVELATAAMVLLSAAMLFYAAGRLWRQQRYEGAIPGLPGGPMIIALVALAAFVFAMEEISWGQTWFGGGKGVIAQTLGSKERNLHNADLFLSAQTLGSVFLIVMFMILPLAWRFRRPRGAIPLPNDWRSAIAEAPVVFCFVIAFVWKELKPLYLAIHGKGSADPDGFVPWFYEQMRAADQTLITSAFYMQFVEQFNEHKEMLVGLGLLMYGLFRMVRAHKKT